jgi:hypothetical protein
MRRLIELVSRPDVHIEGDLEQLYQPTHLLVVKALDDELRLGRVSE